MKSGFVSVIGRPNVGKSTLINSIIGKKIAITSDKPQTTRNIIQGIYTTKDTQIVFVDTPGIHKPNHKLGQYLNRQAYDSVGGVDVILFVVDASKKLGPGDQFILDRLKELKEEVPVILALNKIDQLTHEEILQKIVEYKDLYPFQEIVPISGLKKKNTEELIKTIRTYLTDEVMYYGENEITNRSLDFMMGEMIREKVFQLTREEVPHSVTCVVEFVEVGKTSMTVHASIIVDRDSLKRIIIGAKGSMIKEIGTKARIDIEELVGKKVYLDLQVRTIKKWRDKEEYLSEFGFHDFE
ncbi:MAG TPA: GTPase Era [Candidatus Pelethosoma merdigallinarum]|nr:GTPase Era [Candidatus Pelethosoma merdigallinarum]